MRIAIGIEILGGIASEIGVLMMVFGPLETILRPDADGLPPMTLYLAFGAALVFLGLILMILGKMRVESLKNNEMLALIALLVDGASLVLEASPQDQSRTAKQLAALLLERSNGGER